MAERARPKRAAAPYWAPSPTCKVCGEESFHGSFLCPPCRRLYYRVETRKDVEGHGRRVDKEARFKAMRKQWREGNFRCKYTDIALSIDEKTSRRYATWEHVTPGDESSVVLVAELINKMKADMSEAEFKRMVLALASSFEGVAFDERKFPADRRRTV